MTKPTPEVMAALGTLGEEGTLPVQPIQFTEVTDFTTFRAEYALTEGDIVYHFYKSREVQVRKDGSLYWREIFPKVLEHVATDYFRATFPRLKAAYTEEMTSWWLRAFGFADDSLDPDALAQRFLEVLDSELDKETSKLTH